MWALYSQFATQNGELRCTKNANVEFYISIFFLLKAS